MIIKALTYKILKFVFGGAVGYLINMAVTFTLIGVFRVNYFVAYSLGLGISTIFNFIFAVNIIFNVSDNYHRRFILYIISIAIFFVLNLFSVKLLTEKFGFDYRLMIIMVTGAYVVLKYIVYDKFVFLQRSIKKS